MEPDPGAADRHPWRSPVVVGLLVVAAGMIYSVWLAPWYRHVHSWWLPDDAWFNLRAAHWVANGDLAHIYQSSPLFVATPLLPILLAPVAILGSHWRLSESLPVVMDHPTMWLLYGPVMMASGILVLKAARRLGHIVGIITWRSLVEWALVPLALFPMAVIFGHAEDVLALALVLWGVAASIRGRPISAAVLFGGAIASKQWALLGLPLLVTTSPRGRRTQVLGAALALPAALVILPLALDWAQAGRSLLQPRAFLTIGHRAFWLFSSKATLTGTPFRLGAFALSGFVAWRLRGTNSPARLLAGYSLIFLGRILFEPVVFSYYLGPGLAFLLLHERLTHGRVRRTAVVGTGLLVFFSVDLNSALWWLTAFVGLAVLTAPAVADVFGFRLPGRLRPEGPASSPRSTGGSPKSLRTAASLVRRGTRAPAPVRS